MPWLKCAVGLGLRRFVPLFLAMGLCGADAPETPGPRAEDSTVRASPPGSRRLLPLERVEVLHLEPWPEQQRTWPAAWQDWLPHLPPLPSGLAAGDFDGDGHADIIVGEASIGGRLLLLAGRGSGEFRKPRAVSTSRRSALAPLISILPVDIDDDLDLDLYLVRWGRNEVLINDGSGRFEPSQSGNRSGLDDDGLGTTAAFFDADGDGDLDVYVGNVLDSRAPFRGGLNRFYRNAGAGFVEETSSSGLGEVGMTVSLLVTDLDGDGDPDVLVVNYLGGANTYLNEGTGKFVLHEADSSSILYLGSDAADLDGDLRPDLLISSAGHPGANLEQTRVKLSGGESRNAHGRLGLARHLMAAWPRFLDFDNDVRLDLLFGRCVDMSKLRPNMLFTAWMSIEQDPVVGFRPRFPDERPGNRFREEDGPWTLLRNQGAGWMEPVHSRALNYQRRPTRALVCFDADEDGRMDVLVAEQGGAVNLFLNRMGEGAASARVSVRALKRNRMGIGAKVYLRTTVGVQVRTVMPGRSDFRAAEGMVHFGLGEGRVLGLAVRWPHGVWQTASPENRYAPGRPQRFQITEDPPDTRPNPPHWLRDGADAPDRSGIERSLPERTRIRPDEQDPVFRLERALLADPTDFDLGHAYRAACLQRGLARRPIAFFGEREDPRAPFAWSLQRVHSYVSALHDARLDGRDLGRFAGHAVFELERLDLMYPDTWIVHFLTGLNLLYWPAFFEQTGHAVSSLETCRRLQQSRQAEHFVEVFLGLGDAYGLMGEPVEARAVWEQGVKVFPENEELHRRLALAIDEIEGFCVLERGFDVLPAPELPWLEEEAQYSPLAVEMSTVASPPLDRMPKPGRTFLDGLSLRAADRLLERKLADVKDDSFPNCLSKISETSLDRLWPQFRRGMVYLEYGYLREHLQEADKTLDRFCRELLGSVPIDDDRSPAPGDWILRRLEDNPAAPGPRERELVCLALLGRGDALVRIGRWKEGSELHRIAGVVFPNHVQSRLRDLLSLSTVPSPIWSRQLATIPRCAD
jgi:hypothetical protein